MQKKLTFFIIVFFTSFISVYSQDADSLKNEEYIDSSDVDQEWNDWDQYKAEDNTIEDTIEKWKHRNWNWNWEWDDFEGKDFFKDPTISLSYGLSKMNLKGFSGSLNNPGLAELKLGYTSQREFEYDAITHYKYTFFQLSSFSTDLRSNSDNSGRIRTDVWRFAFGTSSGYGYKIGRESAVIPYYSSTLTWSRIDFKDSISNFGENQTAELFDEAFRFGTSAEGGIKIKLFSPLILEAGYERSIVFPRHLFWKWAGSMAIELAGQWALDGFIDNIMDSSPYAGPIVNFVLKNALSYGIYELRQEKMNWPFDSVAPIAYDQFKFGVTFVF
ncbi:MAG TPA: hypothetical protein VMT35_11125 [Ignavibacteriaceae bacterium]|nr:hypothetical protein [Ignavibacteriaceae bacterium]